MPGHFGGADPATPSRGRAHIAKPTVAVTLVNQGRDLHQAVVSRINDGVTQTLPEILALPLDQQLQLVTPLMATQSAPGGPPRCSCGRGPAVTPWLTPTRKGRSSRPRRDPARRTPPLGMAAEFTVM